MLPHRRGRFGIHRQPTRAHALGKALPHGGAVSPFVAELLELELGAEDDDLAEIDAVVPEFAP